MNSSFTWTIWKPSLIRGHSFSARTFRRRILCSVSRSRPLGPAPGSMKRAPGSWISYNVFTPARLTRELSSEAVRTSIRGTTLHNKKARGNCTKNTRSGTIATGRVVHANPDGYTIGIGNWTSHVGSAAIYPLDYDVFKDLQPISSLAASPLWILGKNALPPKTAPELIAWLKTRSQPNWYCRPRGWRRLCLSLGIAG
jgi:hypothetical protein